MNGGSGGNGAGGGGFFGGGAGATGGLSGGGGGGGGGASYPAPSTQWDTTGTPSVTISANPPTTSVLSPSNGATLTGTTLLGASATNATSVEFRLFGGSYGLNAPVVCTATPTYYGWLCNWNTTTVPSGSYYLASEVFGAVEANSVRASASPSVTHHHERALSFVWGDLVRINPP